MAQQNTTTYEYGIFGELQTVTLEDNTLIEYQHNANHQRVAKLINGEVVEKYLWLNLTTLLATYDKENNLINRYSYTNDRVPTTLQHNNQTYHLLYNHQGSLRAVVDEEGTIIKELHYDSFGIITLDRNPDFKIHLGFAGGLYDEDTKLTRFGYRDYDAQTGKWTATDPIGFQGGDTNLYGYVLGDPVNFVDPLGLYIWEFLTPTDFAPNEGVFVDKNGKKWHYNFDTGQKTDYYKKQKGYCETGKDDGSDKYRNKDLAGANPNNKPPASRPNGNRWLNLLEILDRMGLY